MRTSRSMSWTLSSVMRAWPRIVLTTRLNRSVRFEAIRWGAAPSVRRGAKVHSGDDSIVRPQHGNRLGDRVGAERPERRRLAVLRVSRTARRTFFRWTPPRLVGRLAGPWRGACRRHRGHRRTDVWGSVRLRPGA